MHALTSSIVKMTSRSLPILFSSFDDIDCKDIKYNYDKDKACV